MATIQSTKLGDLVEDSKSMGLGLTIIVVLLCVGYIIMAAWVCITFKTGLGIFWILYLFTLLDTSPVFA
jgi:hypothetical protein